MRFEEVSIYEGPQRSPGFLLWQISTAWRRSIETVLKTWGLTHPQFVVLATIAWLTKDRPFTTQAAIGKMAGLDPNTLSQVIKGLEKKKLIVREPSPDGRAKNPKLTAAGNRLLAQALPAVEQADTQFFEALSPQDLKTLVHSFQKIMS